MLVIYLNFSNGLAVGRGILEIVKYDQRLLLFKEMAVSGTQHPLVEDILERKLLSRKSKWALPWAILNFVVAILFYCDLNQGSVSRFFQGNLPFIWHTEFILAIVFTLNGMYDLWVYAWPVLGQSPLELSPVHRKLFNVQENDVGFKHSPASSSSPSLEPKGRSPKLTSFVLPSSPHSSNLSSSPSLLSSTPLDYSAYSWQCSSLGSSPNNSLLSTSWTYFGNPPANQAYNTSLNISPYSQYRPLGEETVLRHRWESSLHSTPQDSTSPVSSFWNYPHSSVPFTPVLHKNQYQIATRSPQSATSHDDDPDSPTMHSGERIWNKLKISEDQLTAWISNLRKWISQTILVKVVSEIEAVNDDLRRLGSAEVGEGSLSNLRQVALTTGQHLHSLNGLILYLDITSNQEYLVQRLKDLAKGGCMSEFRWNSGGSFKGKPWSDHLPTDSATPWRGSPGGVVLPLQESNRIIGLLSTLVAVLFSALLQREVWRAVRREAGIAHFRNLARLATGDDPPGKWERPEPAPIFAGSPTEWRVIPSVALHLLHLFLKLILLIPMGNWLCLHQWFLCQCQCLPSRQPPWCLQGRALCKRLRNSPTTTQDMSGGPPLRKKDRGWPPASAMDGPGEEEKKNKRKKKKTKRKTVKADKKEKKKKKK